MAIFTGCDPVLFQGVSGCCWVNMDFDDFDEVSPGVWQWNPGEPVVGMSIRFWCNINNQPSVSELVDSTGLVLALSASDLGVSDPPVVGDPVVYSFVVTNVGAVTVSNVAVSSVLAPVLGGPLVLVSGQADVGSFSSTYLLTQADIDAGFVSLSASVVGQDPGGVDVSAVSNTVVTSFASTALNCPSPASSLVSWAGCVDDVIDVSYTPCGACDEVLEVNDGSGWVAGVDPSGSPATCCSNTQLRVSCQGQSGPVANVEVWPNQFRTQGSKILTPCGTEFFGAGMNVAYSVTEFPFVFEGVDNRPGDCVGAVDVWPGQSNVHLGTLCYPGGGVNSFVKDTATPAGGPVQLPDRYYALNGYVSPLATAEGIVAPADNWAQNLLRVNLSAKGNNDDPTTAEILAGVLPATYETLEAGMVVMHEYHQGTGQNLAATGAWNDPTTAFTGQFRDAVNLIDPIVEEFKIDGVCDASHVGDRKEQGYVWFNPMNEPFIGTGFNGSCPTQLYFDTQTFWIERIRNFHNAENIIVIDLGSFGQDLGSVAAGCYDAWWASLAGHASGDLTRNLVLSWHAYGADTERSGGYTYANMDADLNTVLNVKQYPIVVGEYGQAAQVGTGNAGNDQFNRNAFEYLATNLHGQPLFEKYNIHPQVWHGTGDSANFHRYKLVQGPVAATNDGLATPFWDIESGSDPLLEPLGAAHWAVSHNLDALNTGC